MRGHFSPPPWWASVLSLGACGAPPLWGCPPPLHPQGQQSSSSEVPLPPPWCRPRGRHSLDWQWRPPPPRVSPTRGPSPQGAAAHYPPAPLGPDPFAGRCWGVRWPVARGASPCQAARRPRPLPRSARARPPLPLPTGAGSWSGDICGHHGLLWSEGLPPKLGGPLTHVPRRPGLLWAESSG